MYYFLVEYDRNKNELVSCTQIEDRDEAWQMHLDRTLELYPHDREHIELALFRAKDRRTLEYTHSRYFRPMAYFEDMYETAMAVKTDFDKKKEDMQKYLDMSSNLLEKLDELDEKYATTI